MNQDTTGYNFDFCEPRQAVQPLWMQCFLFWDKQCLLHGSLVGRKVLEVNRAWWMPALAVTVIIVTVEFPSQGTHYVGRVKWCADGLTSVLRRLNNQTVRNVGSRSYTVYMCKASPFLALQTGTSPYSLSLSFLQSLSHVRLLATPQIAARQASLSITNSQSSLRLTSIESVMPSSHLILCRPLFLLPPIPPSIRVFSNESPLRMWWPKYWSFSFSIIPSKEHPGLISFRMDWLDLFAVQGTLKSLLQHHSSKASILRHSAFFMVQLSHPYMTTGKTIAWTRQTFVGKVMSLLLNMLSRLVITFLPRSKRLLISWLQSP